MSNQFDPPPQKSGGSNVLMTVLIVCGVLFLGCAGFCGVSAYFAVQTAKEGAKAFTNLIVLSSIAIQSQAAISTNDAVKEKLGDLEFGEPTSDGPPSTELEPTSMQLKFDIKGSQGKGVAHCKAALKTGNWKVTEIKIRLDDGSTLDVPPPSEDAPPALNFDLGNEDEKK